MDKALLTTPGPGTPANSGRPRFYNRVVVLSIGINKYWSANIAELTFAESDANAFAAQLRDLYGYEPVSLLGPQATKRAVEAKLQEFSTQLSERDVLIVFFAGHGQIVDLPSFGRIGFLIPYDADLDLNNRSDPERWSAEAIDMHKLVERVVGMKAQHVLLITDACCTGFMTKRGNLEHSPDLHVILRQPSRTVLAAATELQPARENHGKRRGYFTDAVLETLEQLSRNKDAASVTDLFIQVRRHVAVGANKLMTPQMAHVGDGDGEFVFLPRTIPQEEIDAILGSEQPASSGALQALQDRARKRAARRSTLKDVIEAFEAIDYRYSSRAEEHKKVWEAKLKRFLENASQGDVNAMAGLYYCYTKGLGTEKNFKEAYRWARLAFDRQNSIGKHLLGECYLSGHGVATNEEAAMQLLREGADQNFPLSCFEVARLLLKRNLNREQAAEAIKWLERAKDADIQYARLLLARLYMAGAPGVPKDISKAVELLQPGLKHHLPGIQYALFQVYSTDSPSFPLKDLPKAREWLVQAATAGLGAAQCDLAHELYKEASSVVLGLQQDFAEARKWAQLAADQNVPEGHRMLAMMYKYGHGVGINYQRAIEHLETAIKANHAPAFVLKGIWYMEGKVYPLELDENGFLKTDKAEQLFETAFRLGDPHGYYYFGKYYWEATAKANRDEKGNGPRFLYWGDAKALHLYIQAAKKGHPLAQKEVAREWHPIVLRALNQMYPESAAELQRMKKSDGKITDSTPSKPKSP